MRRVSDEDLELALRMTGGPPLHETMEDDAFADPWPLLMQPGAGKVAKLYHHGWSLLFQIARQLAEEVVEQRALAGTIELLQADVAALRRVVMNACEVLRVTDDDEDDWPRLPTEAAALMRELEELRARLGEAKGPGRTRRAPHEFRWVHPPKMAQVYRGDAFHVWVAGEEVPREALVLEDSLGCPNVLCWLSYGIDDEQSPAFEALLPAECVRGAVDGLRNEAWPDDPPPPEVDLEAAFGVLERGTGEHHRAIMDLFLAEPTRRASPELMYLLTVAWQRDDYEGLMVAKASRERWAPYIGSCPAPRWVE